MTVKIKVCILKKLQIIQVIFQTIIIISPPGLPVKADSTAHFLKGNTMQKIKISTDSTADIPREMWEELDIKVVPLTIVNGDRQYKDGYEEEFDLEYTTFDRHVLVWVVGESE